MDYLLLQIFAILRPIMFIELPISLFGLNLFEVAAIVLSLFLMLGLLIRGALVKDFSVSGIDLAMIGFSGWCITVFAIYPQYSDLRDLARLVLPFLTYLAAKTVLRTTARYRKLLWLLLVGFSVPVVMSAGLIAAGYGVDRINYWTGIPRYMGAYSGPHNMGHNMTFLIMTIVLYLYVGRERGGEGAIGRWRAVFLGALALLALYCLYESAVRTAIVGLALFLSVPLFIYRRKLFVALGVAAIALAIPFSDTLQRHLYYETVMVEKSSADGVYAFASGRPRIWDHAWADFSALPLDRKIAGAGIGNSADKPWSDLRFTADAHNDFLQVLLETGVIGFVLFVTLQWLVLRAVLRLEGIERYLFLAMFIAVTAMNFASNSYVARFGMAQMYYLVLSYVTLPVRREPAPRPVIERAPIGRARDSSWSERGRRLGASKAGMG